MTKHLEFIVNLVIMTRSLTVLGEGFEGLVDQTDVDFIYVEPEKTKTSSCTSTYAVEKLERHTDQVEVSLVVLRSEKVLQDNNRNNS